MIKSEKLYNSLYLPATSKKKLTTLNNIKKACDDLSLKYNKITVTTVSKYCELKWGTPRAQSIRNNVEYVQYIDAREEEREKIEYKRVEEVEVIVKDQAAKAIINALKIENKNLKGSIKNIKEGVRQMSPIDIDKFIAEHIKIQDEYKDLLTVNSNKLEASIDTSKKEEVISEIVKELNKNLLEKYCDISIDYKNGAIFNKSTGAIYWKDRKDTQL